MKFSQKAIALLVFSLFLSISAAAQTRQTREEYIERYKAIAIAHMEKYGIPASITMAQGILESDSGNSRLSRLSNNHFGIKCKKDWKGERVYHDDDAKGECFRAYPSVEASYRDHAEFLDKSPRYDSLFTYSASDYRSWARGLKAAGYATAPDYAERLVKIIEQHKLYLLDKQDDGAAHDQKQQKPSDKADEWFAQQSSTPQNDGNTFQVSVSTHEGYIVYRTNRTFYVKAKAGDSYKSLGRKFNISEKNLRSFNDVDKEALLAEGEIVYIERKQSEWSGNVIQHLTQRGETIYGLSQRYAIRLKSLVRLNNLRKGRDIEEGQVIKLR